MFISSRRAKGGRNPQVVIKFWDCRQATFLKLFRSSYCEYVDGFSTARNFSGFTPRWFQATWKRSRELRSMLLRFQLEAGGTNSLANQPHHGKY